MTKKYKIEARVTEEEKEKIKQIADDKNMTMSSLIINSIKNNITVNLDTSDYRDLVIQVRRIGTNINSLLKNIYYQQYFTDTDIQTINKQLKQIENLMKEERTKIKETKEGIENLTPRKIKKIFEREKKEVPIYLIYDDVVEHINSQLLNFIDMLRENKFEEVYIPYITVFIEKFHPTDYEYDELVDFSNELDNLFYKINQIILSGARKLSEEDFENVLEILDKYRK